MSMAKPIDVDNARYYKLIIVDESHNLRNSQGVRYRNIKDLIQKQDCKVLLLTATPYNKQYKDLSSQLRLFIDDDTDLGIRPEAYIRSIGGERKFAEKHEDFIRSIKAFERSEFQEDWQELMKLFLIRRTRTFKRIMLKQILRMDGNIWNSKTDISLISQTVFLRLSSFRLQKATNIVGSIQRKWYLLWNH